MFGLLRLALLAPAALVLLLAGCASGELPAGSVARVGDQVVSQSDLEPYKEAALAASSHLYTPKGEWLYSRPVAPDYKDCIEAKKTFSGHIPRAQETIDNPASSDTLTPDESFNQSLIESCKSDLDMANKTAVQQLLSATWIKQAAARLGVQASEEEVAASRDQQLNQIAEQSGKSAEQLMERAQVGMDVLDLSVANQILSEKVYQRLAKASDEEMRQYYQDNRADVFPDASYEEAQKTIAATLANQAPDEIAAEKMRAATTCADNYRVLMCGNASTENNSPIDLVPTPSIATMLYPEGATKLVDVPGPNGGVVGDNPTTLEDGGAVYGDVPDFRPETEKELKEILDKASQNDQGVGN